MNLEEYIVKSGVSVKELAEAADIIPSTFYRILRGEELTISMANKIYHATGGQVTQLDLQPHTTRKQRRARRVALEEGLALKETSEHLVYHNTQNSTHEKPK